MAKKDESNFMKAMNGLLGTGNRDAEESIAEQQFPQDHHEESQADTLDFSETEEFQSVKDILFARPEPELPVSIEQALIPSDMVITGNIKTKSNMKISGNVLGDIECEGSIILLGSIQGNVNVANLTIQHGNLTGDSVVRENIVIEQDAMVKGNISAKNMYSNARVEGRIQVIDTVELREKAIVQGDITSTTLSVTAGAKIHGMVDTHE